MNIKRAFLTAAAVLMVPGFAMAQTSSQFPVEIDFYPNDGDGESVEATLTCNTGVPLTQSASINEASSVTFVILDAVGGECDITIDGVSAGFDSTLGDGCSTDAAVEGENPTCSVVAEPVAMKFTTFIDWAANSETDFAPTGSLTLGCNNVYLGGEETGLDDIGDTRAVTIADTEETVREFKYYGADPAGTSVCYATMTSGESALEIDNSACAPFNVAAGTEEADCTITASVFFEGIPTLSQYGMAIMALLMLGVGFVGFRRFV